jgi:hypothetical protein
MFKGETRMSHVDHPVPFRPRIEPSATSALSASRKYLMRHLHAALVAAAFIFVAAGILGLFS